MLKLIDLMEVSLVSLPMNTEAGVTSIKLNSPRDAERWLRSHGWSKAGALKLVSGGWPALSGEPVELSQCVEELLDRLQGETPKCAPLDYHQAADRMSASLRELSTLLKD